jgi:ABC-type transport system involved in cytochrome c biogenesis permease component
MRFLPVVERELRVTARNSRFYWGRFSSALIAIGLVAWFWTVFGSRGSSDALAKQIFGGLAGFSFVYCLLLGIFLTADAISEEKREGTLGLLFLTNLKGYDVILGKLAANSLRASYGLIAIFPVLGIPILLGGLSGGEIQRMILVLISTVIFSLCVGLFASTCSHHDRKAQLGAFLLILFITAGIPALVAFFRYELKFRISDFFFAFSPGFAFGTVFAKAYQTKSELFWTSLGLLHAMSWTALILSALIVPRVWQDRSASGTAIGWREKIRRWMRGSPKVLQWYRSSLLGVNPYFWLCARDRLKPYYGLALLLGCAVLWLLLWYFNGKDMLGQEVFFVTTVLLHTIFRTWLASESGRQFYEDRKSGALELALCTPLPVREILEGQLMALLRQFGPAIGVTLIFDLAGMIIGARMRSGHDPEWILTWVAIIIIFLVDAVTIATLGMWYGLFLKRATRAVAQMLFLVLLLPWIVFIGLITFISVTNAYSGGSSNFLIGSYFVVSLVTDLILFLMASGNLTSRFREMAARRFDR